MSSNAPSLILGSASPRRLTLLSLLLPPERIQVVPPTCEELDFADVHDFDAIQDRLQENVRRKQESVRGKLSECGATVILCADTIVLGQAADGSLHGLGKPPAGNWRAAVTEWFETYYTQRPHFVQTCFSILTAGGSRFETVTTEIDFRSDACDLLPWYLETGEPCGKAGGYGIQGAGSLFATRIAGSFSNVVGLPLERVMVLLQESGFELSGRHVGS